MKASRELAHLLAARNGGLSGLSTPQIQYSSIEDGSLKGYDGEGHLVQEIGTVWDGSHGAFPLTGPVPPRPSAPTVEITAAGSANIMWDGLFLGDDGEVDILITAPMGWARVEIHISQTKGFVADTADTLVDTIETPRGGSRPALPGPGTWYAVLVARSTAGKRSEQSPEASFEVAPSMTEEDIQVLRDEFNESANELNRSLEENRRKQAELDTSLGTLKDTTLPNLRTDLTAAQGELDESKRQLALIPSQIQSAQDEAIAQATRLVEELIATGKSVIANGDFEAGITGWQQNAGGTVIAAAARSGLLGMRIDPTAGNVWPLSTMVPTAPGRRYHMEMWVRRIGTDTWSTQAIGFTPQTRDDANNWVTPVVHITKDDGSPLTAGDIPTTGFTKVQAEFTVAQPNATMIGFAPWFYQSATNKYDVDDFSAVDITEISLQVDKAKQEAIAAAALEAKRLSGLAELAAIQAADLNAKNLIAQGKDATLAAAANAAQELANTAKTEAIRASQTDAQNMADLAESRAKAAAATAQTKAEQAAAAALAAAAAASTADGKAATAQSAADTAAAAAATAQSKANAASGSATAAANLAATKGKILFQTAAPGAEDRNVLTLWIDTTGGANTPKKWVSGTTWAAVTDKAVLDAAAAAAAARGVADAAVDAAATALSRAEGAITAAGSLTQTYYSPNNPSGIAPVGSTWRRQDAAKNIIGEWTYTGGNPAWQAVKVSSEAISNVDIGKLTVGSGAFLDLVAEKMAAQTANIQRANIENLFVTGESKLNSVVAERIAAGVGTFLEVKTGQLVADSANFKTGVAEKFAAGIGSFLKLNASQVYIGEAGNIFPADMNDDGWQAGSTIVRSATGGKYGGASMVIPASTSQVGSYYGLEVSKRGRAPRLIPGQTYRITANVRSDKAIPIGGARVFNRLYNIADPAAAYAWASPQSVQNDKAIAANTWGEVAGNFTVPDVTDSILGVFGVYSQPTTTGALTFSDLIIQPVITPSLIVDGLMNGQRIVGASIETNISTSPNKGIKINDAGLFAYNNSGVETLRMDGINNIFTGATIRTAASGARWQMSANGLEAWNSAGVRYLLGNASGLEMIGSISSSGLTAGNVQKPINVRLTTVSRDIMGKTNVPNPALIFDDGLGVLGAAPGVYSPDANTLVLQGKNSGITGDGVLSLDQDILRGSAKNIYFGRMGIYPTLGIELLANKMDLGQYPDSYAGLPGTTMTIEGLSLTTNFKSVNFKIDGKTTPLGSTGWLTVSLLGAWRQYGNDFHPLSVRYLNGTLHLMGTIKGGTNGQQICTLPAGYRPSISTLATEVPISIIQGTTWYGGSIYVYADGRVFYNGAPGIWSGTDRVVINAHFPHGIV